MRWSRGAEPSAATGHQLPAVGARQRSDLTLDALVVLAPVGVALVRRSITAAERSRTSHHRIALWAAWEAHKTAKDSHGVSLLRLVGLPETQKAFAEFLGVSDRTVRNYRDEYGEFVGTAQTMTFNRLLADYRLDAAQALGQVATDKAHPQFAQSQRTFFTLTGDLVDKQDITSGGEKVQQITVIREDRNAVTSADDETE